MKKFYLAILMALWTFTCQAGTCQAGTCQAGLSQAKDMEEVVHYFNNADAKTLAIFDIDMVLVQPSEPAFQLANMKRFSPICKRIMKEMPQDKQMMFLSLISMSSEPVLIDARIPSFLQQIAQKGIRAMALTANLTGEFLHISSMEKWRIETLRMRSIDFSKNAPYQKTILFNELASYRNNYTTYLDGVLFVNGTLVSKGDALVSFLEKTKVNPHKIIFIDDREDNLKSVQAALQKLDPSIEYVGIHFLGALNYPSKMISEEEFEAKWLQLAFRVNNLN